MMAMTSAVAPSGSAASRFAPRRDERARRVRARSRAPRTSAASNCPAAGPTGRCAAARNACERRAPVDVGAVRRRAADRVGMILGRRPVRAPSRRSTSRRASTLAPRVEQRFERVGHARARGRHEHRLAFGQHGVRVGAGLEQRVRDRGVAVHRRELQRRHAVAVGRARVGAGASSSLQQLGVAVRGPVQRVVPSASRALTSALARDAAR